MKKYQLTGQPIYVGETYKENTFYARKFRVSVEVSSITGAGGEIISQEGNLNQIGDVVIGEFNTQTKTFTEAAAAPANAEASGT